MKYGKAVLYAEKSSSLQHSEQLDIFRSSSIGLLTLQYLAWQILPASSPLDTMELLVDIAEGVGRGEADDGHQDQDQCHPGNEIAFVTIPSCAMYVSVCDWEILIGARCRIFARKTTKIFFRTKLTSY